MLRIYQKSFFTLIFKCFKKCCTCHCPGLTLYFQKQEVSPRWWWVERVLHFCNLYRIPNQPRWEVNMVFCYIRFIWNFVILGPILEIIWHELIKTTWHCVRTCRCTKVFERAALINGVSSWNLGSIWGVDCRFKTIQLQKCGIQLFFPVKSAKMWLLKNEN